MRRYQYILIAATPAIVAAMIWQVIVAQGGPRMLFLFGSPLAVARVACLEIGNGAIFIDLLYTLTEILAGLILGTLMGIAVGFSMWLWVPLGRALRPYVVFAGGIPIFALAPMLIIWFGTGFAPKVIMATFAVFLVALVQAFQGAASAADLHLSLSRSLGASRRHVIYYIIVPSSVAWVLMGLRLSVGSAIVGSFIGEFVISERGLGRYILRYGALYDMPRVLFGVLLLCILAAALGGLVGIAERRWAPWAVVASGLR